MDASSHLLAPRPGSEDTGSVAGGPIVSCLWVTNVSCHRLFCVERISGLYRVLIVSVGHASNSYSSWLSMEV